jgi:hypothetical protein
MIDDFFGIQMNPSEEDSFQILNYSSEEGINYRSTPSMNPDINAWAEIELQDIVVKINNSSGRNIKLNSFSDQFILITDQQEYKLSKSNIDDYFPEEIIPSNGSLELKLEVPADYGQDFEKRKGALLNKDIMGDISKNWSLKDTIKGNIKFILIRIDDIVLVLKNIPEE